MSVNRIFNVLLLYLGVLGLREGDNAVNKTSSKIARKSYDQAPNDSVSWRDGFQSTDVKTTKIRENTLEEEQKGFLFSRTNFVLTSLV